MEGRLYLLFSPLKLQSLNVALESYHESRHFSPRAHISFPQARKLGLDRTKIRKISIFSSVITQAKPNSKRFLNRCVKTSTLKFKYVEVEQTRDYWMLFASKFPWKYMFLRPLLRGINHAKQVQFSCQTCINDHMIKYLLTDIGNLKFLRHLKWDIDFWCDPIDITDKSLKYLGRTLSKITLLEKLDIRIARHNFTEVGFQAFCDYFHRLGNLKILSLKFYRFLAFVFDTNNTLGNDVYAHRTLNKISPNLIQLKQLNFFKLVQIPISSDAIIDFCKWAPRSLKGLNILMTNTWIDDKAVDCVRELIKELHNLESLKLNLRFAYQVSNKPISSLFYINKCYELKQFKLDLSLNSTLEDTQLTDLSNMISKMKSLKVLSLRFSYLKFSPSAYEVFFESLANLLSLQQLKLVFDHTEMDERGLKVFNKSARMLNNLKRMILNFSSTQLTSLPLDLSGEVCPQLRDFEIYLNEVFVSKSQIYDLIASISKKFSIQNVLIEIGRREDRHLVRDFMNSKFCRSNTQFQLI